jgi:hypothetical protein
VGAIGAGWRAGWLRTRPDDSPLPSSERDSQTVPDLELDDLDDVRVALLGPQPSASAGREAPSPKR